MPRPRILWNLFHEDLDGSRGNRLLFEAVRGRDDITVNDQYAHYPDFRVDVEREQRLLIDHDLIVFQHPFYWYSTPALLKQWEDKVLTYGFAYPPKEGKELHGKAWLSVITTGGSADSYRSGGYNNFTMSELLRPLQQTAYLCGMTWQPPFIIHGVLPADYEGIRATSDDQIATAGQELNAWLDGFDPSTVHSLEPVVARHALA